MRNKVGQRQGLQGGSPPDETKDIGRLSAKQAGMREQMKKIAEKLKRQNVSTTRIAIRNVGRCAP